MQQGDPQRSAVAAAARVWGSGGHVPAGGPVPVRGARGVLELLLVREGVERAGALQLRHDYR